MNTLRLRRYDVAHATLQAVCRYWQQQGAVVRHGTAPPGAVLAQARSHHGVELLVDLRAWFSQQLEEKSSLRADWVAADDIRDLFHYSGEELSVSLPGEAITALSLVAPVSAGSPTQPLPVVSTSCGDGWLLQVNDYYRGHLQRYLPSLRQGSLQLRLECVLGHSQLSMRYVKKLAVGDVLMINRMTESIQCGSRTLAKYRQQEDYFMLEDHYDDEDDNTFYPPLHEPAGMGQPIGVNNIPVQLTFIVHQITMTLEELEALHIGDVIDAGEGGENSVAIHANGAWLAQGELVMVDQRLGVEIQTLCHEARDGK